MGKSLKCFLIVLALALLLTFTIFFFILSILNTETIYHGIYIDGFYVGGLTREEALLWLKTNMKDKDLPDGLTLSIPFDKYRLPFEDIEYGPDYGSSIDKAYLTGREGNLIERLKKILVLRKQNLQIYPEMCYNKEKLEEIIRSICIDTEKEPKNAEIKVLNSKVRITPHQSGYTTDQGASLEKIEYALNNRLTEDIELCVNEILPDITTQMVDKVSFVLGEFYTYFNAENDARVYNINTASDKINQTMLLPEESFSMDQALGDRTEDNGYKLARVIINNELVYGLGGGICQVTSTLYNSVLLSGLEILERRNHTLPLTYIGLGRDATISQGYIDFRFKNNTGYAIIIESKIIGNQVLIKIWGKEPQIKNKRIIRTNIKEKIMAEGVLTEIDTTLKPGQVTVVREAVPGYIVEVFIDTIDETGKVIKTEKISVDHYIPQKKKIKISPYDTP